MIVRIINEQSGFYMMRGIVTNDKPTQREDRCTRAIGVMFDATQIAVLGDAGRMREGVSYFFSPEEVEEVG